MTECARILRLLARRVRATKLYESDEPTETDVLVKLEDAEVLVHLEGEDGRATGALSFLIKKGSLTALHLNQWRRHGRASVPTLVDDLWEAFWEHELENRALGRIQWMHGPELPPLPEDVPVQEELPFELHEPLVAADDDDRGEEEAPDAGALEVAGVDAAVAHPRTLLELEVDPVWELLDSIKPGTPVVPALAALASTVVNKPPVVEALAELADSVGAGPARKLKPRLVDVDVLDLFGE